MGNLELPVIIYFQALVWAHCGKPRSQLLVRDLLHTQTHKHTYNEIIRNLDMKICGLAPTSNGTKKKKKPFEEKERNCILLE